MSTKASSSVIEQRLTNLFPSDALEDRAEASPKTNSHPTLEHPNFGSASDANPVTKPSKPSSKQCYDSTNNRLHKSVEFSTGLCV